MCQSECVVKLFSFRKSWNKKLFKKLKNEIENSSKFPSANEWIQKLWYIYAMEFYAAERKKELIPFSTAWMELENIMLSELIREVRDKYHMTSRLTGT